MIRRPPRSTPLYSSAASDVYKRQRLRMDEEYDEMSTYAFAQSVVKPTQETAAFINRLNALVDETNALYNQRIAQARAAAAKKQEGDKPATDSDSPSEI